MNCKISLQTTIGYCPMMKASPTDFNTVYTVMKNVQKMMSSLHQKECIITFDLAIYVKAKEMQYRKAREFADMVIRMGGFHIALNFLSVIGKIYRDSGLEDLLIESDVYGSGAASALLNGKSYNRGVRAHKLTLEGCSCMSGQECHNPYNEYGSKGISGSDDGEDDIDS